MLEKTPNHSTVEFKVQISLAIIAFNEEKNIERCLRSVPFASDVVVVDSGSHDRTRELAAKAGARVFEVPWKGFRDQKRHAAELCQNDWVLSLDADEALSSESASEIRTWLETVDLNAWDAASSPRLTWNLGRWIRHGGWYPDRQTRLFHRRRANWQGGEQVHERIEATRVSLLKHPILHWPFESLSEQVETNNRYSGLGALELQKKGTRFSIGRLLSKPISKFLETYVVKSGYRDGLAGFIISVSASYSVFLKFAKLWEIEARSRSQKTGSGPNLGSADGPAQLETAQPRHDHGLATQKEP